MKLIYRGATYEYHPINATARRPLQRTFKSPDKLIYRGNAYWVDRTAIREISVEPVVYELSYRGNTYQVIHNEQGQVIAIA